MQISHPIQTPKEDDFHFLVDRLAPRLINAFHTLVALVYR